MASLKIVFFDLGDVVCDFVPHERLEAFTHLTSKSAEDLERAIWGSRFSSECDEGKHSLDEMYMMIRELCGSALSDEAIQQAWCKAFRLNREVAGVAQDVARGVQVGLLTNNAPILRAAIPEAFPEIDLLFDPILFSYEFGVTKPSDDLFAQVERKTDCSSSELMLVDDSLKNIEAAASRGWQTVHYKSVNQLKADLDLGGLRL